MLTLGDIVSINEQILILKIISECDVKHIMMSQIKTILSLEGLKILPKKKRLIQVKFNEPLRLD